MSSTAPKPPPPKPPCQIHPTAIIADKAQLTGSFPVEIHEGAIIQPHARIRAETGRVVIGKNSRVAERAVIGIANGISGGNGGNGEVVIGQNVVIQGGAVVKAAGIGDWCVIEAKAVVGAGAVLGRLVKVTAGAQVGHGERVDDFVVVFGDGRRRVDETVKRSKEVRELKRVGHEKTMDLFGRLIPNGAAKWTG